MVKAGLRDEVGKVPLGQRVRRVQKVLCAVSLDGSIRWRLAGLPDNTSSLCEALVLKFVFLRMLTSFESLGHCACGRRNATADLARAGEQCEADRGPLEEAKTRSRDNAAGKGLRGRRSLADFTRKTPMRNTSKNYGAYAIILESKFG